MRLRASAAAKAAITSGLGAVLLALSACSGSSGGAATTQAPVTQSNITLPSSVQVVTAN